MAKLKAARPGLTGATLVRLLEALSDPQAKLRNARVDFAEGLVQWIGWADAIALSAALERPPAADSLPAALASFDARAEGERVRAVLAQAVGIEVSVTDADMGYSLFRRRYATQQQAMEDAISALRERVRAVVAVQSADLARLAAVDAVMARALHSHERRLLANVPGLMERYYRRLQREHEGSGDWIKLFREDMQAALLAELDLRMQPVEGLIESLTLVKPEKV